MIREFLPSLLSQRRRQLNNKIPITKFQAVFGSQCKVSGSVWFTVQGFRQCLVHSARFQAVFGSQCKVSWKNSSSLQVIIAQKGRFK